MPDAATTFSNDPVYIRSDASTSEQPANRHATFLFDNAIRFQSGPISLSTAEHTKAFKAKTQAIANRTLNTYSLKEAPRSDNSH